MEFSNLPKSGLQIVIAVFMLTQSALTEAGEWSVSADLGRGELDIKPQFSIDGNSNSVDNTSITLVGGYKFDSNFIVETSFYTAFSDNLFGAVDDYIFSANTVSIGYLINVNENFNIVSKIGFNDWKLTAREGAFLNPGPEDEFEYNGSDSFWQLNVEFPVNDKFLIYAGFMSSDTDIGKARSNVIGVKFAFE